LEYAIYKYAVAFRGKMSERIYAFKDWCWRHLFYTE